uniref:Roadblock/LAMTOR2 domain-containing protein n=1 Tax=Peronospora matthiolae TaxID=2874970 RepID=A0AAV1T9Z0_9STRA
MSFWCRCLSRRRGELQRQALFQAQFERIQRVYPGTGYVCLLDGDTGAMIAQSETTDVNTDEFTRTIMNLKDAALQFAATLNQIDPQVVHVRGAQGMFSCYGSAHMILAFYSDMSRADLESLDCFEADKSIESITGELHRIIDASQTGKRRNRC